MASSFRGVSLCIGTGGKCVSGLPQNRSTEACKMICEIGGRPESAGINRHRVGDERAPHERSS